MTSSRALLEDLIRSGSPGLRLEMERAVNENSTVHLLELMLESGEGNFFVEGKISPNISKIYLRNEKRISYRLTAIDHWIFFDYFFISKHNTFDDCLDVFIRPNAK